MFTRIIAALLAAVVLLTASPALAQSSDLLSSAERAALTMAVEQDMEQDQSVVRRRRSGGVGAVGAVLVGVGVYLALQPPDCELVGDPRVSFDSDFRTIVGIPFWNKYESTYEATRLRGECVARVTEKGTLYYQRPGTPEGIPYDGMGEFDFTRVFYSSDEHDIRGHDPFTPGMDDQTRSAIEKKTMNQIGWATAAAGGVLLVWGLRGVDVPVRLDVAPTGGFRISRSFGW